MATVTDPARELADIAERLSAGSSQRGEQFLAMHFGVQLWSTDFVKIIACILERADLVARIVAASNLDEDDREKAVAHLQGFKSGFTGNALRSAWHESGNGLTAMKDHGSAIRFLSATVRSVERYPRLTEDEVTELVMAIDTYLAEIRRGDESPAFVRQAIIDGLTVFKFQLEKIGWMGSGYTLAAFRQILSIYKMSESQLQSDGNPDAEAFLKGLLNVIVKFKGKVDAAKGWSDSAEAVFKAYQVGSSVALPLLLTGNLPTLPGH